MVKKRKWLWITLFIWAFLLVAGMAAGWNVVIFRNYRLMLHVARVDAPWTSLALGSLGFVAVLGTTAIFFLKILKEMQLNQQQSEFLATVTHELKTPIAAIELASSFLKPGSEVAPDEAERLWEIHQAELKRLKTEVETLLQAARAGYPINRQDRRQVHLESWLESSLTRWRALLGSQASIERSGEPLDINTYLDEKNLNLIVDNILDNARKYAKPELGPQVRIRTRQIRSKNPLKRARWQIQFEDSGLGFYPSDSQKIFTRFFRAPIHEAKHAIAGTGLGLFLAASASQNLGITLRGDSSGPGHGAVFTLEGRLQ